MQPVADIPDGVADAIHVYLLLGPVEIESALNGFCYLVSDTTGSDIALRAILFANLAPAFWAGVVGELSDRCSVVDREKRGILKSCFGCFINQNVSNTFQRDPAEKFDIGEIVGQAYVCFSKKPGRANE